MSCIIIKSFVYCVYVTKKGVRVNSGGAMTETRKREDGSFMEWDISPPSFLKKKVNGYMVC